MRTLLAALLVGLAAPAAHAQLIPSVDLGVAAGVNFASLNDVAAADLDNSTGFHAGVYADFSAAFLSVRSGLFYLSAGNVQQGAETVSADFVTIPVDFQFQTPTPIVRAYALAGPEFRFPIGESGTRVDKQSVNVAANVGLGAEFGVPLSGPSGFVEVRYALDVTGFAEDALGGAITGEASSYKLNLFMVRAGIGL